VRYLRYTYNAKQTQYVTEIQPVIFTINDNDQRS